MKLVIDIPDEEYKDIKDNPSVWSRHFQTRIGNGIPLAEFCDSCIYKKDEDD